MSTEYYSWLYAKAVRLANKDIEIWRIVKGYEGLYEVSNLGRVRSIDRIVWDYDPRWENKRSRKLRGRILSQANQDYLSVMLSKDGIESSYSVHRLVLEAFAGPCPDGMEACHWDGNSKNNRIDNLRWDTRKNNHIDKQRHGTNNAGQDNPMSATGRERRYLVKADWESGKYTLADLSTKFDMNEADIVKLLNGKDLRGERKDNVIITAFGRTLTQKQWSLLSGISDAALNYRMKVMGMSPEDSLTKPDRRGNCLKTRI